MSKQTAVELFALDLYEKGLLKGNGDEIQELLEQAKQMHKKEIMKVVMDFGWSKEKADKYYNDTYGGENE